MLERIERNTIERNKIRWNMQNNEQLEQTMKYTKTKIKKKIK
jgi:hypothetical protein